MRAVEVMVHVAAVAAEGMATAPPRLVPGVSTGGSYFLHDPAGAAVAVLKPQDEEAFAPNNPKGRTGPTVGGPGIKKGAWGAMGPLVQLHDVVVPPRFTDGICGPPCSATVLPTRCRM